MKLAASLIIFIFLMPNLSYASEWCGFEGIYVGMPAAEAKAKGFTCHDFMGEHCDYTGTNLKSFYGEKVNGLGITITKGKVSSIQLTTDKGSNLLNIMSNKIGKPLVVSRGKKVSPSYEWNKGDENITVIPDASANTILFEKVVKPISIKSEYSKGFIKRGRDLFTRLIKVEKDQSNEGDKSWYRDAIKLDNDCKTEKNKLPEPEATQSELFGVCIATAYLYMIGQDVYGGRPKNDYMLKEVKTAFKIK